LPANAVAHDPLPPDTRADKVIVMKKEHVLMLMRSDHVLKTYKIALGGDPVGPKQQEGDHKTPEGFYILDRRNQRSRFYRSLHISYPNAEDQLRAAAKGISPGGDIVLGDADAVPALRLANFRRCAGLSKVWRLAGD